MSHRTGFAYSRQRVLWILVVAGAAAVIAFAIGRPAAGWGVLAATPVGIFNYYIMYSAVRAGDDDVSNPEARQQAQIRLLKRSMLRLGISGVALLAAIRFGPEALIGVLVGIVAEMMTYMGEAVRFLVPKKR